MRQVVIIFFDDNKEVIHFYLSTIDKIKTDVEICLKLLREEAGPNIDGSELKIDYCIMKQTV